MPSASELGQAVVTVSDKLTAIGQQSLGAVSGVVGTLSSSTATAFNAFADKASLLLKQGNISPAALTGAAMQVTESLQQSSIYKGIKKGAPVSSETQPEETKKTTGSSVFKFPQDLGDHYIQLTFEKFVQNSPVDKEIKTDPVIIQLPLSPSMVETYQANYKTENLNVLGGLGETVAQEFIRQGGMTAGAEEAGRIGARILGSEQIKQQVKDAGASLFATGVMAGVPGVGAAFSRALGATINPNMAVLFDNVGFRSHQFAFKLNPRSAIESRRIKEIITAMRQRMLPPRVNQFFYGYPDKVKVQIFPKQPYPILECVLESMSVNYAPNGPAFYKGSSGDPVSVDIQLQFKEIVLFTREKANEYDFRNQGEE